MTTRRRRRLCQQYDTNVPTYIFSTHHTLHSIEPSSCRSLLLLGRHLSSEARVHSLFCGAGRLPPSVAKSTRTVFRRNRIAHKSPRFLAQRATGWRWRRRHWGIVTPSSSSSSSSIWTARDTHDDEICHTHSIGLYCGVDLLVRRRDWQAAGLVFSRCVHCARGIYVSKRRKHRHILQNIPSCHVSTYRERDAQTTVYFIHTVVTLCV